MEAGDKTKVALIFGDKRLAMLKSRRGDQRIRNQQPMTQPILLQQVNRLIRNLICDFQNLKAAQKQFEIVKLGFIAAADN
jgi:hypothetical protein